ncbi:mannosyltransferase [Halorubrum saccharovorum DSM 1137]|uniref:Mannosyltransferase n=1 Tax=Halorubrum saccharovorum DSM 1137 TaxID=1227484 RepID=M0DVG5_9EURY|nr:mannosyltransferase [Halorubrum saccharovorum DSM 1137]
MSEAMTAAPDDRPIRVLQVSKHYHPVTGGIETVVEQLVSGIEGVSFRVLTATERGLGGVDSVDGVPVVRAGNLGNVKSTPLAPSFPVRLRRQAEWADLVHYHLPFPVGPVSHLLARVDAPTVVTFHDDIIGKGPVVYPYRPVLDRFLRGADRLLVTSPNMRDECETVAPFADKTTVIPLGIDADETAAAPRRPGGRRVLFVGRLVPFKGVSTLLAAMERVDGSLSVVGTGPERDALEREAARRELTDRVTFEGFVSDARLDRLYREADVFVLPSVGANESFGIVQLEAMQRGLPVVNTDLPTGVPYVSVDGETGRTVPPGDPEALAAAVEGVLDDPDRYERFSESAIRRVRREFTSDRLLRETEAVYREVLDEAEPAGI